MFGFNSIREHLLFYSIASISGLFLIPHSAVALTLACPSQVQATKLLRGEGSGTNWKSCQTSCRQDLQDQMKSLELVNQPECPSRIVIDPNSETLVRRETCVGNSQADVSSVSYSSRVPTTTESNNEATIACSCMGLASVTSTCVQEDPSPFLPTPSSTPTIPGDLTPETDFYIRCLKTPLEANPLLSTSGFATLKPMNYDELAPGDIYFKIDGYFHPIGPETIVGVGISDTTAKDDMPDNRVIGPSHAGLWLSTKMGKFKVTCGFGLTLSEEQKDFFGH